MIEANGALVVTRKPMTGFAQPRRLLCTALCVVVASCLSLAAPAGAGAQDSISLLESFDAYSDQYREARDAGDVERFDRLLSRIQALRVERNAFQLHDVASGFVLQAMADLESGRLEEARKTLELAADLDPTLPTAYWGQAFAGSGDGSLNAFSASLLGIRGWFAAWESLWNRDFMLAGILHIVFGCLFAVAFVFALAMVYRYGALMHHELLERFPEVNASTLSIATGAVLLAPLILTFGIAWLVPFWLTVTFGYQSRSERGLSIASLLLVALLGPVVSFHTQWARSTVNPLYRAALSSIAGTFDEASLTAIEQAAAIGADSRGLSFLLASQYKNLGAYEAAAREYRRLLDRDGSDEDARINLGNTYFAQRDWDGAIAQYERVIQSNPSSATALFNKALAHGENFQFGERETAFREAEAQDPLVVSSHEAKTGSISGPIELQFSWWDLQRRFLGLSEGMYQTPRTAPDMLASLVTGSGIRFIIGAGLFLGMAIVLQMMIRNRRLTKRCWKCSSAFCGKCQIGTGRRGLCTQCYHLFHMKDGVSVEVRNKKLRQVDDSRKRRQRLFRFLSIVFPGSGHFIEGGAILGVILALAWSFALGILVFAPVYELPADVMKLSRGQVPVAIVLIVFALGVANLVRPTSERR